MASDGDVLRVLAGGEWARQLKWPSRGPPTTSWNGVREVENDRVIQLSLGGRGLTGSIPSELGRLTNLRVLNLLGNELTGSIPPELGQLQNLNTLWLNNNLLTGSIPRELGQLQKLEVLWLNDNQLTGSIPKELGQLQKLERLWLERNQLTGSIPPELGNLSKLTELFLYNNKLEGSIPSELDRLTNLTVLSLSSNQLTGEIPKELGNLTNLVGLGLNHNNLEGSIPPELGQLQNLKRLWLNRNLLTGPIPAGVIGLLGHNLTQLSLTNNGGLTLPEDIGTQLHLTKLDLSGQGITGSIPPELGQLQSLQLLSLQENKLTGKIPKELGKLTNLTLLNLASNQLTGSIPSELGRMKKLQKLLLSGNHLTEQDAIDCASLMGRKFSPESTLFAFKAYICVADGDLPGMRDLLRRDPEVGVTTIFLVLEDYVGLDSLAFNCEETGAIMGCCEEQHLQRVALEAVAELILWQVSSDIRDDILFALERSQKSGIRAAGNQDIFIDFVRLEAEKIDAALELLSNDASFGAFTIFRFQLEKVLRAPMKATTEACITRPLLVLTPLLILTVQVVVPIILLIEQVRNLRDLQGLGGPRENRWFCPNSAALDQGFKGFEAGLGHLQQALATTVAVLYFARFFMLSARKLNTGERLKMSQRRMKEIIQESTVASYYAVDDFMDVVYEGIVYWLNLRIVLAGEDILSMLLNSLALEFVMRLDDDFKEAYLKVHGEGLLQSMKEYEWIGPRFADATPLRAAILSSVGTAATNSGRAMAAGDTTTTAGDTALVAHSTAVVTAGGSAPLIRGSAVRRNDLVSKRIWRLGTEQWLAEETVDLFPPENLFLHVVDVKERRPIETLRKDLRRRGRSSWKETLVKAGVVRRRDSNTPPRVPIAQPRRAWGEPEPYISFSRIGYIAFIVGLELYFLLVAVWSPFCHVTSAES